MKKEEGKKRGRPRKEFSVSEVSIGTTDGPKSIDEILGFRNRKYPFKDINEYKAEIKSMTNSQLNSHAIDIGIKPTGDRDPLIAKLLREFETSFSTFSGAVQNTQSLSEEKRKKALEILKRGR